MDTNKNLESITQLVNEKAQGGIVTPDTQNSGLITNELSIPTGIQVSNKYLSKEEQLNELSNELMIDGKGLETAVDKALSGDVPFGVYTAEVVDYNILNGTKKSPKARYITFSYKIIDGPQMNNIIDDMHVWKSKEGKLTFGVDKTISLFKITDVAITDRRAPLKNVPQLIGKLITVTVSAGSTEQWPDIAISRLK